MVYFILMLGIVIANWKIAGLIFDLFTHQRFAWAFGGFIVWCYINFNGVG